MIVRRIAACSAGSAVVLAVVAPCYSALNWVQGSTTYQHIKELSVAGGTLSPANDLLFPNLCASGSSAGQLNSVNIALQTSTAGLSGGGTSTMAARAGRITNSTTAGVALKSGTGATQIDPTVGGLRQPTQLIIDLPDPNRLEWSTGTTSYSGKPYFSMTLAGSGAGSAYVNLGYYVSTSSLTLGSSIAVLNSGTVALSSASLVEGYTLTIPVPATSSIPANRYLHMIGEVILTTDKTSVPAIRGLGAFDGEISVLDASFGFMDSNTHSTYVGSGSGNWFEPFRWASDGSPLDGIMPNAAGARARFKNDGGLGRTITLNGSVRAGVVEVVGSATTQFSGSTLTFNCGSTATAAMLWQDSAYGNPSLNVQCPVATETALILQNDSTAAMNLTGGFGSTAPGAVTITKRGTGSAVISGTITNSAGMTHNIEQGVMTFSSNMAGGNVDFNNTIFNVGTAGTAATLNVSATQTLTSVVSVGSLGTVIQSASTTFSALGFSNQGTITTSGILDVTVGTNTNNGRYTQLAGTGSLGNLDGTGTTTVGASAVLTANRIRQVALTVSGNTTIRAGTFNNGSNSVSRLTSLTVAANRKLDLKNNALVVDYTAGSPRAALEALIASGRTPAATWTGNGIISSTAGALVPGKFSIGIAETTDTAFVGGYLGQAIDSTTVLLRYTLSGDFNLSGTVDLDDFTRIAANFGLAGRWGLGDATYDGVVDLNDFTALASNFGLSAMDLPRSDAVPEPTMLAVLSTILALLRRRRQVVFVRTV